MVEAGRARRRFPPEWWSSDGTAETRTERVSALTVSEDRGTNPRPAFRAVARRAIVTSQYRATSIGYRADRRATHVPYNNS